MRLNYPVDGVPQRTHLEFRARKGSVEAQLALQGPECPESLAYLLTWARQLHGKSGVGMNGFSPLSWSTIDAWARWTGNVPDPEDVDALFMLDTVMLSKPEGVQ